LRENCSRNLRDAAASEPSLTECRAYLPLAMQLSDYDSAKEFLNWWAKVAPADPDLEHQRVTLELMAGNYGVALKLIDSKLAAFPNDPWARESRRRIVTQLQDLLSSSLSTQSIPVSKGELVP
jgi:hypothetical protein